MLKPTKKPIRLTLKIERPDEGTCEIEVYEEGGPTPTLPIYRVLIAAEDCEEAQKRALADVARHLHWFLTPNW